MQSDGCTGMTVLAFLLLLSGEGADDARVAVDRYAACMVQKNGYRVRPLLDQPLGDRREGERWLDVLKTKCIDKSTVGTKYEDGAEMRFRPTVIRGAIFEALLKKDYAAAPKQDSFEEVAAITYAAQADQPSSREAAYAVTMDIGECSVRKAPALSYALLESGVATKGEMVATKALLPTIGACTQAGITLEFSLSIIRGMIAEPMYRLTKAKLGAVDN